MINPLESFRDLYELAKAAGADWPEACCLASADAGGKVAARMVLFRVIEPLGPTAGVSFFTNYESDKARDLDENPDAALCVYWHRTETQVRIRGPVVRSTAKESDDYFAGRPRGSQIGAWASAQSRPLDSDAALHARVRALEAEYEGKEVPRPPHWGGFRIVADRVEIWTLGEYRLHHRESFTKQPDGTWAMGLLNP